MNTDNRDALLTDDFDRPKLTTGLNVLTILSIIGCILQLIGSVINFMGAKKNFDEADKVIESINSDKIPAAMKGFMPDPEVYRVMVTNSYNNRIPIFILMLVSALLCFYGVLQMRKLKKQGYTFYMIGELLPFAVMAIFIGTGSFSGIAFIVSAAITLLFVLLYTLQRKNLVY